MRATDIVIAVLTDARADAWLTMREIIQRATDRGQTVSLNAVASALANIESGQLFVDRSRRPFRYRLRFITSDRR